MKFIYTGQLPIKDADLVLAKIFKPNESIKKGAIFEVPDDDILLLQRIKMTGYYEEYIEPKKVGRPKKDKLKEDKQEKEEEEN